MPFRRSEAILGSTIISIGWEGKEWAPRKIYRQTGWIGTVEVNRYAGLEPGETFCPDSPPLSRSTSSDGIAMCQVSQSLNNGIFLKTRPYTRQHQSRTGGQVPWCGLDSFSAKISTMWRTNGRRVQTCPYTVFMEWNISNVKRRTLCHRHDRDIKYIAGLRYIPLNEIQRS